MAWWLIAIAIGTAGASYVQAKKAQKKAKEMTEGVEANIESNSKEIPVVYGKRRVGGVRVYIDTSRDKKHQYLYMVLAMAEGEVESITDIKIDDISIEDDRFNYDGPLNSRNLEFEVFLGSDDQEASTLIGDGVSYDYDRLGEIYNDPFADQHERDAVDPNRVLPWSSKHKLSGVAYLALKFKWDEGAYTGIPDVTAVVKGRKVYDPRTDTTAWSDNPALCIRDYLTNERFGKGLPASAIDDVAFSQAANDLDSFIAYPYQDSPEYQYLFRMNHVVDTSKKIMENLNDMIIACRGFIPYSNGVYSLKIDQTSNSVLDIGPDQIISGIAVAGARKEDRFNQVKVNFFNASSNYKEDQAIYPEQNSTLYQHYLAEDEGEPLVDEIDLYSIDNYYSAREMARLFLERSRQNMTIAFQGTSELINLEVGEVVSITHPTPAWTNKLFQVQEVALAFDGTVQITCIEYDAALYTYDTPAEEQPYVGTRLPDPNQVEAITNLTVSAGAYIENDGKTIGYLDIDWDTPDDALVDRYELEISYSSKSEIIEIASESYRFKPTQDGVDYTVAVRSVNGLGIRSSWLEAAPVTSVIDTVAPSDITNISISSALQSISLEWTNPSDDDFDLVRIKVSTTSTEPQTHTYESRTDSFVHDIGSYTSTRHYWLAPVDRTGNVGNYVSAGSATTGSIDYGDIDNPPTIPTIIDIAGTFYLTLPDDNAPTDVEFNTAVNRDPIENDFVVVNKEFAFVYDGSTWSAVTEFIDGSLLVSGSLSADDITTGTLNANDVTISNLTVTSGQLPSDLVYDGDLGASGTTVIDGGRISAGTAVTVGTGDNVAVLSGSDATYRLWAGDATSADAPFKVSQTGVLYATGAEISGNITAGSIDAENITFTGSLIADGLSNIPNVEALNMTQSLRNAIEEIIVTKFGSDASTGYYDEATGSFDAQDDNTEICRINTFQHNGSNIDIDVTFSRSWQASSNDIPSVTVNIQRSVAGANSWTTIKTQTITGSVSYVGELGNYFANIQGVVSITDNPTAGNYDYRFFAGTISNLSLITISARLEANEQGEQIGTIDLANYGALAQDETITGNWTFSGTTSGIDYGDLDNTPTIPTSFNILNGLANYVWDATENARDWDSGLQLSFVQAGDGYPSYGTVIRAKTYDNDGGNGEIYFPYSSSYGGDQLQYRVGKYNNAGMTSFRKIWDDNQFSSTDISNWDTAYGWGNHADAGYLTVESYENLQQLTFNVNQADSTTSSNYNIQGVKYSNGRILAVQNITGYTGNSTEFRWRFRDLGEASPSSQTLMSLTPTSYNTADLEVSGSITATGYNTTATGNTSLTASTGIKQTYAEGWTAVFADYEPHHEWGLYHDNPSNQFIVTGGVSTNNIGSFSVTNHSGDTRTAYRKIILNQTNGKVSAGGGYNVGTTIVVDSAKNAYFNSVTGSASYHEFGDATGSVSNDGTWNARLNLAGTQHAKLDVKSVSDGIITSMYAHTGHGSGRIGTTSDHPLGLVVNGTVHADLKSTGVLNTSSGYEVGGTSVIDASRNIKSVSTLSVSDSASNGTSNGMTHYQWEGATYRNPSTWTARQVIRIHNDSTGDNGHYPSLVLYNESGLQNSTVGLSFASREEDGAGNSVPLAGIHATKTIAGVSGGWSSGSLTAYVKDLGTRRNVWTANTNGSMTVNNAMSIGQDASAMDTINLDLETVGNMSIRAGSYLYFGITTNNHGSWKTRLHCGNTSTMQINSQALVHNNVGYGTSTFFTSNASGMNVQTGGLLINSTTVIDSSRNITNIGTIGGSGNWETTGNRITINTGGAAYYTADGGVNQWKYLSLKTNGSTKWDIACNESQLSNALQFRPNGGNSNVTYINSTGLSSPSLAVGGTTVVDSARNLKSIKDIHQTEVHRPDASYSAAGNTSGRIKIALPDTSSTYDMMTIELTVYEYNSKAGSKIYISGHNWTSGWYNYSVQVVGDYNDPIYLARSTADGKNYIILGDVGTTWNYVTVHVDKVTTAGFYSAQNWTLGWSISRVTTDSTSYSQFYGNLNDATDVTLRTSGAVKSGGGYRVGGANVIDENTNIVGANGTLSDLTVSKTGHNYVKVNGNGAYEAMTRYNNSTSNYWYTGIRTSTQLVGNTGYHIYSSAAGRTVFGLTAGGEMRAQYNVIAYYSDDRLKTKVGKLDNALSKVCSLNGFIYVENEKAKELGYDSNKEQVGLSAQEVQNVLPQAVRLAPVDCEIDEDGNDKSISGEDYLTLDYAKVVPLLVEAIKELKQEIEELKNGNHAN